MKKLKKAVSFILMLAVVLSFAGFPASGADQNVFPLSIQRQTISGQNAEVGIYMTVDKDGNAYAWGTYPDETGTPKKIMDHVASVDGMLLLKDDGTVWEYCYEPDSDKLGVWQVPGLKNIVFINSRIRNIAIEADGTVWTWNVDVLISYINPVKLDIDNVVNGVDDIFLKSDGTVWYIDEDKIVQAEGMDSIIKVSPAFFSIIALKNDGTVWNYNMKDKKWSRFEGIDGVADFTDGLKFILDTNSNVFAKTSQTNGFVKLDPSDLIKLNGISDVVSIDNYNNDGFDALFVKKDGNIFTIGDLNTGDGTFSLNPVKDENGKEIKTIVPSHYLLDRPAAWAKDEVSETEKLSLVPEGFEQWYNYDITRKDFCTLAVNMMEKKTGKTIDKLVSGKGVTQSAFTDTDDKNILAAAALGIVNGRGGGGFCPDDHITRQEAAAMLYRTAKVLGFKTDGSGMDFADRDSFADWAKEAVAYVSSAEDKAAHLKVMNGMGDGKFEPELFYTRQQALVTIKRLFNVQ
ncbi:MAG: S-layer homology domain-containing protein [Bacillota bacterium]|nr:S-layer homology domain-containing protein [Bacillota bacterium]